MGSVSTALFVGAALVAVFANPASRTGSILRDSVRLVSENRVLLVIPAYLVWLTMTALANDDPLRGARFLVSQWQLFFILPLSVGLYRLSPDANLAAVFSRGLRIGLWFALVLALVQLTMLGMRPLGFSGNELVFATLCAVAGGLSFANWSEDNARIGLLSLLSLLCAIAIIAIGFSRGLIVTMVVILAICLIYQLRAGGAKVPGAAALFAVFAVAATVVTVAATSERFQRLYEIRILEPIEKLMAGEPGGQSISERALMLVSGWQMFWEKPLFGYGIQNTVPAINTILEPLEGFEERFNYTHLHNDYLNHAVGGGVPLFVLFSMVLWVPVLIAVKLKPEFRDRAAIVFFAVVLSAGYATTALTNVVLRNDLLATLFSAAFCFILVALQQQHDKVEKVHIPDFGAIYRGDFVPLKPDQTKISGAVE